MQRDSSDLPARHFALVREIIAIKCSSVELKGGEELHCVTYKSRERALMVRARRYTRVDSGMRCTRYNSPGAVIIHDAASTR